MRFLQITLLETLFLLKQTKKRRRKSGSTTELKIIYSTERTVLKCNEVTRLKYCEVFTNKNTILKFNKCANEQDDPNIFTNCTCISFN